MREMSNFKSKLSLNPIMTAKKEDVVEEEDDEDDLKYVIKILNE